MLRSLRIENFKGFDVFEIEFSRLNLLVGGNNSGKTTIFHALQFFFWAFEQIAHTAGEVIILGKTQTSEVPVVPYAEVKDLFNMQSMRKGRSPTHIKISLQTDECTEVSIELYQAYGRNFMITGNNIELTGNQYEAICRMNPVFVPSAVGITAREDYYRPIALRSMINQGRHNQVLRNLVYQLRASGEWEEFANIIRPLFNLKGIDVPFEQETDLWLKAVYQEGGCNLDFVSAGSGFLQIVNLLTFILRKPTQVALLDEPDSHMHEDLLRLAFNLLDKLSERRQIQLLIATHSPILVDSAGLSNVLLIDRTLSGPRKAQDVDELVPMLADQGLALPPSKVMDTLKSRRVLFVEGSEKDYEEFIRAFGLVLDSEFAFKTRGLSVFQIGEGRKEWPFDAIRAFERLMGVELQYVYVSDRDFLMPCEVTKREARATKEKQVIHHLERRNRECYLIEPAILSRLLLQKWAEKFPDAAPPTELHANRVREWFLAWGRSSQEDTQARLLVENESFLRGDIKHRAAATQELLAYFRQNYTEPLTRNEIPYRLIDGKETLKAFRRAVSETTKLNFRDVEIIKAFQASEVSPEVCEIISALLKAFSVSPVSDVANNNPPLTCEIPDEVAQAAKVGPMALSEPTLFDNEVE